MKVLNKIAADFENIINNDDAILKNIRIENFDEFKKNWNSHIKRRILEIY